MNRETSDNKILGRAITAIAITLAGILLLSACGKKDSSAGNHDLDWWQQTIAYEIYVKSFNIKQARNPPSSSSGGMNCRKIQKKNKKNTCSRTKEVI